MLFYLIQKALWSVSKSLQLILMLKNVISSICCKIWASCKNVIFKHSSDGALQSNALSTLSTDGENVIDRKENERETNRESHPAINKEV